MRAGDEKDRPLRLVLVDDHEVVRLGLRALIERHPDLEVIAEAGNADEAVQLALSEPDVVVMDVRLPGRSGIDACAEITRVRPDIRIVMLTSYAEDELLAEAITTGASGYVLKQVGSAGLLEAIRDVARGRTPLDSSLTGGLFARVHQSVEQGRREAFADLSEQELRILAHWRRARRTARSAHR